MAFGDVDSTGGDYSNEGRNYSSPTGNAAGDTQSPGGGWSGSYNYGDNQLDAETNRLNRYNNISTDLTSSQGLGGISPSSRLNMGFIESLFAPGAMAYRLGLRAPGTSANDMFDSETEAERADRLGLLSNAIDTTFGGIARAAMPAPISLALGLYNGYQDYSKNKDVISALSSSLNGQRGLLGAIGNAAKGNYGSAVAGALGGLTSPMNAALAGIGVDTAQGKGSKQALGGLFGGWAGSRVGGPIGGAIGSRAGRGLAGMF